MNDNIVKSIGKFKRNIYLLAFMVCCGIGIDAKAEVYGDFEYEVLEDNTIEIADYIGDSGIVIIPDKIDGKYVVSIADGALQSPREGKRISSISVSSTNQYFSSQDGVLFNKDKTLLISCPETKVGTYNIPNSVLEIGYTAFISCDELTKITIPDGLTCIGPGAFEGCYGLSNISLPNSVEEIGYNAFYWSGITSIVIPSKVTYIEPQTFQYCDALQKVTLPEGIHSISYSAFSDCYSLQEINFPKTLCQIGDNAFSSTALTSVTLFENVATIDESAFSCCFDLESINISVANPYYSSLDGILYDKKQTKIIHYPDAKTGTLTIPANLTELNEDVWSGMSNLEAVNVNAANCTYSSVNGVLYNKLQTELLSCPGQKQGTVTIPNTVSNLTDYAFGGCTKIQGVIMSDSVTELGEGCFSGCSNLSNITMSSNITKIGSDSFADCTSLKRLMIPSGVTSLKENFTWDITLIVKKNSFGENYAKACGLNYEYTDGTKPGDKPKYPAVHVGDKIKASGAVYKITNKKKKTVTYVKPTKKKSKVTIPATVNIYGKKYKVTSVGANAFKNNKKLKSIVLGKNIVKIEKNAFRNCKNLGLFRIKSTKLKSVGKGAIKNCPKIDIKASKRLVKKYRKLFNKKGVY